MGDFKWLMLLMIVGVVALCALGIASGTRKEHCLIELSKTNSIAVAKEACK